MTIRTDQNETLAGKEVILRHHFLADKLKANPDRYDIHDIWNNFPLSNDLYFLPLMAFLPPVFRLFPKVLFHLYLVFLQVSDLS